MLEVSVIRILLSHRTHCCTDGRIYFKTDNIGQYFKKLGEEDKLPDIEELWTIAQTLVRRYATQEAYETALSLKESEEASEMMKIPVGTPWMPPVRSRMAGNESQHPSTVDGSIETTGEASIVETADKPATVENEEGEEPSLPESLPEAAPTAARSKDTDDDDDGPKKTHVESPGFDGDRVLANSILFLQDAGWWIEASYAVPEGDIGRVYKIVKVSGNNHGINKYSRAIDLDLFIHWDIQSKLF